MLQGAPHIAAGQSEHDELQVCQQRVLVENDLDEGAQEHAGVPAMRCRGGLDAGESAGDEAGEAGREAVENGETEEKRRRRHAAGRRRVLEQVLHGGEE